MPQEIRLPDLGEGVAGGTVAAIMAKKGQTLDIGDGIIEIETDKAVLPVPAPVAGTCVEVIVKAGEEIKVGQVIALFEVSAPESDKPTLKAEVKEPVARSKSPEPSGPAVQDVLVADDKMEPAVAGGARDVRLPELGEGVTKAMVASIAVVVGDEVQEGDALIEIETDKAVLPVPAPFSGKVISIAAQAGVELKIGQVVLTIESTSSAPSAPKARTEVPASKAPASAKAATAAPAAPKKEEEKKTPASAPRAGEKPFVLAGDSVPAGPATRKLARELGVKVKEVKGSARYGRVTIEDVKAHVKTVNQQRGSGSAPGGLGRSVSATALPDFSTFGEIRREPLSSLRKIVSRRMSENWNRVPHVFQFQDVDITNIVRMQQQYAENFKAAGSSASPTNFVIKALAGALMEFPQFNASLDEERQELILKSYVNIGVAVDTPSGLIVPVLKHVDKLTVFEIGRDLRVLAQKTRDRKVTPEDLSGASMTLSNLGGIGGTHFTPIVNWPEVAILGMGRTEIKPLYIDGKFVPRSVSGLCLSYDHRVIDGADGARFIMYLKDTLENMERTLLGR